MFKVVINVSEPLWLSGEAHEWMRDHGLNWSDDTPRHHPLLVACVETLGPAKCGSAHITTVEVEDRYHILSDDRCGEEVQTPENVPWTEVTHPGLAHLRTEATSERVRDLRKKIHELQDEVNQLLGIPVSVL